MVDVLLLAREHGPAHLELAVRGALTAGAHDGRAVGVLARRVERPPAAVIDDLPERLIGLGSPEPTLDQYDSSSRSEQHDDRPAEGAAMEALIDAHAVELNTPTVRRRFRQLRRRSNP